MASAMGKQKPVWKDEPEDDDYSAAWNFLSLLCPDADCKKILRAPNKAEAVERAAKDLLRASDLPLLSREDAQVDADLQKLHKGKPLAPVLLVRGNFRSAVPLLIADGYHRICAVWYFDEKAKVACRLASMALPR